MGTVISGAGGKAAKARAAATRTNGSFVLQPRDQLLGRLAAQFLVFRMDPGQGPQARRAQHLVVALGVGADRRFGVLGNLPQFAEHERGGRAGVLIAQQGRNLRHGRRGGLAERAQREHGLAANLRLLVLQLLGNRRNRVFGRGANIAEDDQGPKGGLVVLQGFDQPGHGLDAAFRDGVQNPPADGRIGILQQLGADRDHHFRAGVNGPDGPHGGAANGLVGVFQQLGQGRHGILGGGADRPQGQRRVGADLGRLVFEQFFDRLDGLGRLLAAGPQLVEGLHLVGLFVRLQVLGHERRDRRLVGVKLANRPGSGSRRQSESKSYI